MKSKSNYISDICKHKSILAGFILLAIVLFFSCIAPIISRYNPIETSGVNRLKPPSLMHLMGTDQLGRDIMSRVLYGGRSSLLIGAAVVVFVTIAGTIVGALSGYYHKVDVVVMRILDGFMAFPSIIIAITLAAIWGTGKMNIILALSFANFSRMARVVRASVLSIKELDYINSAKALGAKDRYIIFKYIIRNSLSPIIVQSTFIFAISILDEAALSFLGVGIKAPEPSWGGMISEGRNYLTAVPWLVLYPGGAMLLAVLGLNILGDGLQELLAPRLRS